MRRNWLARRTRLSFSPSNHDTETALKSSPPPPETAIADPAGDPSTRTAAARAANAARPVLATTGGKGVDKGEELDDDDDDDDEDLSRALGTAVRAAPRVARDAEDTCSIRGSGRLVGGGGVERGEKSELRKKDENQSVPVAFLSDRRERQRDRFPFRVLRLSLHLCRQLRAFFSPGCCCFCCAPAGGRGNAASFSEDERERKEKKFFLLFFFVIEKRVTKSWREKRWFKTSSSSSSSPAF